MAYDFSKQSGRLFIYPRVGGKIEIGKIRNDCLTLIDLDNYHKESQSLGVDREVIFATDLIYKYITYSYNKKVYPTTRFFVQEKGVERNILNSRKMLFIPLTELTLSRALRYEKAYKDVRLEQLDIFDVLKDPRNSNNQLLRAWEQAINK